MFIMPVQVNCQHKSIEFDKESSVIRCNHCGWEFNVGGMSKKEIKRLLKNLPEIPSRNQKPASVSCYSPVHEKPSIPDFIKKNRF
jgi:hypothetical protein